MPLSSYGLEVYEHTVPIKIQIRNRVENMQKSGIARDWQRVYNDDVAGADMLCHEQSMRGSVFVPLVARQAGQYDRIVSRLKRLSPKQLEVVQAVVDTLDNQNAEIENIIPFQAQTEAQLFARIDHSLAQIDAGLYEDADDVVTELLAEIDA